MGANKTQAQAAALFLTAFVSISAGLAEDVNLLWLFLGILLFGAAVTLFLKCRPWEHGGEGE